MNEIIEPIRIEIPLGNMFHSVNCYLIPGAQLTLVDCGWPMKGNWNLFQEKIKEQGYQVSDIEQVIITHEHRDHIGLLPEILAHSNAIVRAPKMIEEWFTKPAEMNQLHLEFFKKLIHSVGIPKEQLDKSIHSIEQAHSVRRIEETDRFEFFKEGDILQIGNTNWEVLNTPGHCPTQHVFLQQAQKRIFSSDMILPIAPMPIVVEGPKEANQPVHALKELLNSFERLRGYDIQTIYPGHGPIFDKANEMIDKQLARMKMRKEECFEAIKSGLNTPYKINRKMYPYQEMPPNFSGLHMVLGYIDLLLEEGLITKEVDKNGVTILS